MHRKYKIFAFSVRETKEMLPVEIYQSLRNVPISSPALIAEIGRYTPNGKYKSPAAKLSALEKGGDIIRLKRGLYVLDSATLGYPISAPICAQHIYGPSYLSMQWALSYYSLIPERAYVYTSVTTKRTRLFDTPLGRFSYHQVAPNYYSIGITIQEIDNLKCLVASPEKALADAILMDIYVPYNSRKALATYLEEDLRMDMDAVMRMDTSVLQSCSQCGRKQQTLNNLIHLIKHDRL